MKTLTMIVAGCLALGVAAFPAGSAGVGKIAIGSTGPFTATGAPADVSRGAQAYFRFVNARGGVNGRQIEFELIDDGGDASRAATNARRLIERDGVFALFSVVGSEASLSVRDVAAAAHVPEVFSAATARALGTGSLATGYPPSEFEVAEVYAEHLLATDRTQAKVGVLYADDLDGQDALAGFRQGLGKQGAALLAASESVGSTATDVTAALKRLQASGANTLALFAPGTVVLAAYPGPRRHWLAAAGLCGYRCGGNALLAADELACGRRVDFGAVDAGSRDRAFRPRSGNKAGPADPGALRHGPVERLRRRRNGRSLLLRRRAAGRGGEPDQNRPACVGCRSERSDEPVSRPGSRGAHERRAPVPCDSARARAQALGTLGPVRRDPVRCHLIGCE